MGLGAREPQDDDDRQLTDSYRRMHEMLAWWSSHMRAMRDDPAAMREKLIDGIRRLERPGGNGELM